MKTCNRDGYIMILQKHKCIIQENYFSVYTESIYEDIFLHIQLSFVIRLSFIMS